MPFRARRPHADAGKQRDDQPCELLSHATRQEAGAKGHGVERRSRRWGEAWETQARRTSHQFDTETMLQMSRPVENDMALRVSCFFTLGRRFEAKPGAESKTGSGASSSGIAGRMAAPAAGRWKAHEAILQGQRAHPQDSWAGAARRRDHR
jgi:hypothetical protein